MLNSLFLPLWMSRPNPIPLPRYFRVMLLTGLLGWVSVLPARGEVVIGVLYPLTGLMAEVGQDAVAAVKAAVELINEDVNIPLPLGPGKGFPKLEGARVRVVIADHQGRPETAQSEALRLITQEHVQALFGGYHSTATLAAARVSERLGIPFVNADSSAPDLTRQNLRWLFRTGPHEEDYTGLIFKFLEEVRREYKVNWRGLGIVYEESQWGQTNARDAEPMARQAGFNPVLMLSHPRRAPGFSELVERLKTARVEVVLPSSFTGDALGFILAAQAVGYHPGLLVAQNGGFANPEFLKSAGPLAEGLVSRATFSPDLAVRKPLITQVEAVFRKFSKKRPLTDIPARAFTGFLVLAEAINRAKDTDPKAIHEALEDTDFSADEVIMPWRGVRFGKDGQNQLTRGILMQVQQGKYCTVYPLEHAACPLRFPTSSP
ncbi:MAG: ABC transporter substrate-binding protein [Deltaproteobacteria bacterium]|nr:ABC transporter substrate-binding protein [Deltaproteobacteria bacterium]